MASMKQKLRGLAVALAGAAVCIEATSGPGLSTCPCINPYTNPSTAGISSVMTNNRVVYRPPSSDQSYTFPTTWGNGCAAHDQNLEPYCHKSDSPAWCDMEWCYVKPEDCTGAVKVKAKWLTTVDGLYFSYATCLGAGGSGATSVDPWDDSTVDNTKFLIKLADRYVRGAVAVLENAVKDQGGNTTCIVPSNQDMCPCDSCAQSSTWDSKVDFLKVGIRKGPGGTATQQSEAVCLAEEVGNSYKAVAAKEMDADFSKVGYSYFAESKTGSYAQYPKEDMCVPGKEWKSANGDQWDPRYRDWYTGGATGPKDVILVVDVSGSMAMGDGRHEKALMATKLIIDTLTWKDFVGVVLFDTRIEAYYKNTLVPATEDNKRAIKLWCDRQEWAGGGTNFRTAFHKAFEIISASVSSGSTSMCQKALMFLTDGQAAFDSSDYSYVKQESIKYDVFIFSYTIGDNADKGVAKKLACQNRGVYYPVSDNDDLASIMVHYYDYFAQGQEICQTSYTKYSALSSSLTFWGACMPMYDRRTPARGLLGVSCLDVNLLRDLTKMRAETGWSHFVCQATDITKTCRSLDLSECHLQRIRKAFSDESVCTAADNAGQTYTDITLDTECPCQDPNCQDDPNFRDEKHYYCDTWIGDDCLDVDPKWNYTQAGIQAIQENCKRSCGLCEWSNPCPRQAAGECTTVPIADECRACLGRTSGVDIEGNSMDCPSGSPRNPMKRFRACPPNGICPDDADLASRGAIFGAWMLVAFLTSTGSAA